jgi:hypothetical protein
MLTLVPNRNSESNNQQGSEKDLLYTVHTFVPQAEHGNGLLVRWCMEDRRWSEADFNRICPGLEEFEELPDEEKMEIRETLNRLYFSAEEVRLFRQYMAGYGWNTFTSEHALPLGGTGIFLELSKIQELVQGNSWVELPKEGEEHLLPFKARGHCITAAWLPEDEIPERNRKAMEEMVRLTIKKWIPTVDADNILIPKSFLEDLHNLGFYVCMNSNKV